jgi:hypothetical protein
MRRKFKITFEADVMYPDIKKESKRLSKDFDNWIKEWAMDEDHSPLPLLFEKYKGSLEECEPSGRVSVKVERDGEVILHEAYDEWGSM